MTTTRIGIHGHIRIAAYDKPKNEGGRLLFVVYDGPNLITDNGLTALANVFSGVSPNQSDYTPASILVSTYSVTITSATTYADITGGGATVWEDTISTRTISGIDTANFEIDIAQADGNIAGTYNSVGIVSSNSTLIAAKNLSPGMPKNSNYALNVTWSFTMAGV